MARTTLDPRLVRVMTQGGAPRIRQRFEGGSAVGPVIRCGGEVRRIAAAPLIEGGDLSDAAVTVETVTALDDAPAGVVWQAEGECTLDFRGDSREGFGGSGIRQGLAATLFIERMVPVGSVTELLAKAPRRGGEGA